jgi:hypothetical protein
VTVLRELFRHKLDLVGMQELRWKAVTLNQQEYTHFSVERGLRTMNWVRESSAVKSIECW